MDSANDQPTFRIFISSPGDVGEERELALRAVQRLQGWFRGRAILEPYLWEREPLLATKSFQEQIDRPSKTDLAVFILWSRLGTPLSDTWRREDGSVPTGTEWEFEDALTGHETGATDLLVYRKRGTPVLELGMDADRYQALLTQRQGVEHFFERWFRDEVKGSFTGAFHEFGDAAEFGALLEAHLATWLERRLESGPARVTWTGSPFRGLETFGYEHAPVFFGRTRATHAVRQRLRAQVDRGVGFVLVTGMSGSGKSSLVLAGVLPLLESPQVVEDAARGGFCRRAVSRPGATGRPFESLARALLDEAALPELGHAMDAQELASALASGPSAGVALVKQALAQAGRGGGGATLAPGRIVLVLDQFEGLFAPGGPGEEARTAFVQLVDGLARSGVVWVLCTLRSDFYDRFVEHELLAALKDGPGLYDLAPPSGAELGQLIRLPAQAAGLRYETRDGMSLDQLLEDQARRDPRCLPLLEFTLDQLYHLRDGPLLTFAAYEQLGELEGALANRAEEVHQSLPEAVQAAFPRVMRSLVQVGTGSDVVTRRTVTLESVTPTTEATAFVDAFCDPGARLFTRDRREDGTATVTIAHEALIRSWPRLQRALEQDRELLRIRERVGNAAARWREQGCPKDLLLPPGQPLLEARRLLEARGFAVGEEERAYVRASASRARRRRWLARGAVGLVLALLLVAGFERIRSAERAEQAVRARHDAMRNQCELAVERTHRFLSSGAPAFKLLKSMAARGDLAGIQATRMADYLALALSLSPGCVSISWGGADGTGDTVLMGPDGTLRYRLAHREAGKPVFRWYTHENGTWTFDEVVEVDYDSRRRPWYVQGVEAGGDTWTEPYIGFTTKDVGCTLSTPQFDMEGMPQGVWALDFRLAPISHFLGQLEVFRSGRAYLVSPAGQTLGVPVPPGEAVPLYPDGLVDASSHEDPLLAGAWRAYQRAGDSSEVLTFDGFLAVARPLPEGTFPAIVLVVAPAEEVRE